MMVVALGWLGSVLYLINHGYISVVKNWQPKIYYAGNFIAAVSLVISSIFVLSYQAVVINGFWALISIMLLVNIDVSKIPLSKKLFNIGLILILAWIIYVGFQYGVASSNLHVFLGWSSTYVFCLSYFLFSSKKLSHFKYLLFNIYAACALLPLLWAQQNWPVFSLEVCWALISAYGVLKRIEQVHLID